MNEPRTALDDYRAMIEQYTRGMAVGRNDRAVRGLGPGYSADHVKMFTDGNLDKRFQKIRDQVELFEEALDDLDDLIAEYVKTLPLAAYDTGCTDAERFLDFLERRRPLTDEQRDLMTCQRSRHAVEFAGRDNRMAHVRFQELLASAGRFEAELETNPRLWIHLNPIHVWAVFRTTILLDEDDAVPARAVFYAVENDIRTTVLDGGGLLLVQALEEHGPARLAAAALADAVPDRAERIELLRDLCSVGLVAFG